MKNNSSGARRAGRYEVPMGEALALLQWAGQSQLKLSGNGEIKDVTKKRRLRRRGLTLLGHRPFFSVPPRPLAYFSPILIAQATVRSGGVPPVPSFSGSTADLIVSETILDMRISTSRLRAIGRSRRTTLMILEIRPGRGGV